MDFRRVRRTPNQRTDGSARFLPQIKTKMQPSLDARATISTLDNQMISAIDERDDADDGSLDAIKLVVNTGRGDPAETANGDL
jgi:hypothetical protein